MEQATEANVEQKSMVFQRDRSGSVRRRRLFFAIIVTLTMTAMASLMAYTLSRGGLGLLELVLTACFLVTLPWTAVGFWNAIVGLVIMRAYPEPGRLVCPGASSTDDNAPITESTAILLCIRHEDPAKVARNLELILEGLVNAGQSSRFHAYILSDSSWDETVQAEKDVFRRLQHRWRGIFPVTYRLRNNNAGYKAGNIRDFCHRWGGQHDYALVLDADSLMSTPQILRMVRTMQRNPRLGILQSLVVGMPATSLFTRIFQFGMRLGMRSYTLGSAWWQADCGPYWGHNALIRLAPFMRYCRLPELPGGPPLGGWILSHDQVEAALMRKAGYEVRVLPEEGGSWEENPPTLLEFIRRDLRWCHGNMQYWRLIALPGLKLMSRIQLLLAILMYLGSPAWVALMTLGFILIGLAEDPSQTLHVETSWILFACIMLMVFAPKLATLAQILASSRSRAAFGGPILIVVSTLSEIVLSALLAPVVALAHTLFLLGLPLGRAAIWSAQRRSNHMVSVGDALKRLWPQTLFGVTAITWLFLGMPTGLVGLVPFVLGPTLAVPIALLTSWSHLGVWITRIGLWRIPDETSPAAELQAIRLPALRHARRALATSKAAFCAASGD